MARSSYIYVITRPMAANPVVAAFTVKHECQSYIEDAKDGDKELWTVRRYRDGGSFYSEGERNGVVVTFEA